MVGYNDGRFSFQEGVPRDCDLPAIEDFEDTLDPSPIGRSDEGRGIIHPIREEVADGEQE
jgi:hypothetical protein